MYTPLYPLSDSVILALAFFFLFDVELKLILAVLYKTFPSCAPLFWPIPFFLPSE